MKTRILGLLAVGLLAGPAANAAYVTFDLNYSGAAFGNTAVAFGSVTFDDAILPVPAELVNVTAAALGITAFSITVSGAASGNGTFGLSDVTNWVWSVDSGLDLTQNLVGQAAFLDFNWCATDFDGCTVPAPGGSDTLEIRSNAETGDPMRLTSMAPDVAPVPLPAAAWLLLSGLGGLGFLRRRKAA